MSSNDLDSEIRGWWRITQTSAWVDDGLDDLGQALISLTGYADRLRMHCLIAYVNVRATKSGASFTWEGAWEYDPMRGTGSVRPHKDGTLRGTLRIENGTQSSFTAERISKPDEAIPDPPSYRDKWGGKSRGRRW